MEVSKPLSICDYCEDACGHVLGDMVEVSRACSEEDFGLEVVCLANVCRRECSRRRLDCDGARAVSCDQGYCGLCDERVCAACADTADHHLNILGRGPKVLHRYHPCLGTT